MKFAVVILVVLGIVAAGAAAIFVQSMSFFQQKEAPQFDVLVAAADLLPRTALTEAQVEVKKMPRTGLPADFLAHWSQAAGKTLKVALVKGQPLASSQFIPKNSIDELLKPGMLAFPAPLSGRSTPVNLLYPGCIVDVFATFPLTNRAKGDAVVTPLLQNIRVLAVAEETVIEAPATTKKGAALEPPKKKASPGGNVTVTLELTARQAAALSLVMEKGTLGLAMRNPNDKGWNPMEPMVIKEGQLTAASETLDPQTLAWVRSFQRILNPGTPLDPNVPKTAAAPPLVAQAPDPNTTVNVGPVPPGAQALWGVQPKKSAWPMEIIRGQKVEKTEIEMDQENKPQEETSKGTGN
jgi:Flp pilus assembly protein CpaB